MYYEETKDLKENKGFIRQFYEEFYNARRYEALDEMFSPSYVHHTPEVPGEKMDYDEYREHLLLIARAFPHMKVVVHDQVAEGDKVTTRFTMYGTQEGDLPGIPAEGRQIQVDAITILRVADGKIAEGWECYDSLGMALQLETVQIVSTLSKGPEEKGYFPGGPSDYNV